MEPGPSEQRKRTTSEQRTSWDDSTFVIQKRALSLWETKDLSPTCRDSLTYLRSATQVSAEEI